MDRVRRFRNLAVLVPIVAFSGTPNAWAASARTLCGAPAASAVAQYCEAIPTPTGGKRPHPGTPAVAKTLPPAAVHQLSQGPQAERPLLTLPAASHRHHRRHTASAAGLSGAATSIWSISVLMIVLLALLALGLGGLAIERRRRRSGPRHSAP
jgi:hypothetical protein